MRTGNVAVFPGSFDPLTLGHEDIVRRALTFADRVVIGIAHHPSQVKAGLFDVPARVELIREVFAAESRVAVADFSGLLVEFARSVGANLIVRGVRGAADFEYETRMAHMNRSLAAELETVLLVSQLENAFVSASLVREVALLGGDVSAYLSLPVARRVRERLAQE